MQIITMEYKYIVLLKLLKKNEKLEDACSKSGLLIKEVLEKKLALSILDY